MHSIKQLSTILTETVTVALSLCAAASACMIGCARVLDAAVMQAFCDDHAHPRVVAYFSTAVLTYLKRG
jgi:hypothetical protein